MGAGEFKGTERQWVLYIIGQIQYVDEVGNERFMGFCRLFSGAGGFQIVDNADYEYQD